MRETVVMSTGGVSMLPRKNRDVSAMVGAAAVMVTVAEGIKWLTPKNGKGASRKVLHAVAAPVFVAMWPLFTERGRYHAAVVPLAMTLKFALVGAGVLDDPGDVAVMARTGDRREILRGPLMYGVVATAATVFGFRSVSAAAALASLCLGDCAAEVVGRRFGTNKLPWSPRKSYVGSLAFLVASYVGIIAAAAYFSKAGLIAQGQPYVGPAFLASFVGALVESLPMPDVDNILVPPTVAFVFAHSLPLFAGSSS